MPPVARDADGLTVKERRFAETYMRNGHNGVQAVLVAGYKNGQEGTKASDLLRRPQVKAFVEKHQAQIYKELDVTFARSREALTRMAQQGVEETTVWKMQMERIKIDAAVEKNIQKLLPTMTQEMRILAEIQKNHNQARIMALKILADVEANSGNAELLARLQSLEAPPTKLLASETTLTLTTGQLEASEEDN